MTLLNDRSIAFLLAAAASAFAANAQAALVIDIRAAGANPKNVTVSPGGVVALNVYATVTGANATADDGLQLFFGSFVGSLTNGGSASGDFSTFTAASPFNANTQPGKVQDLNGQAGLDLGSIDATPTAADYIWARASAVQVGTLANPEFLVGTLQWTVTNAPGTGTTTLNFDTRDSATGTPLFAAATWREDGVTKTPTSAGTSFSAGAPVNVTVPEPTTLAAFGLAALVIGGRRRAR